MGNMKEPPTPREHAEKRLAKERADVLNTLSAIKTTWKGIIEKKEKVLTATSKDLKKKYIKQVKASNKYLDDLYDTLKLEQYEAICAEISLNKIID